MLKKIFLNNAKLFKGMICAFINLKFANVTFKMLGNKWHFSFFNKKYYNLCYNGFFHKDVADRTVKWLGKPAAEPKVPGSNPGRHGCRAVRPWPHQWLRSKTGRREVPGTFLGRACRPSRSEFSCFSPKLA